MPNLTIIAGCNGAGKPTFAPSFLPEGQNSFDYDKLFLENYNSLPDSEFREQFAKDKTTIFFESSIEKALKQNADFCYETNFDVHPLYWAEKFRLHGYTINLIFFCLENQEIAKHRIQVRTEFSGHFVDNKTVDYKWKAGYKNLNENYDFFDNLLIVDNSNDNSVYSNILQIKADEIIIMGNEIPSYFSHRLPAIFALIKD